MVSIPISDFNIYFSLTEIPITSIDMGTPYMGSSTLERVLVWSYDSNYNMREYWRSDGYADTVCGKHWLYTSVDVAAIRNIEFALFYDFSRRFWNFFDILIFFCFAFYTIVILSAFNSDHSVYISIYILYGLRIVLYSFILWISAFVICRRIYVCMHKYVLFVYKFSIIYCRYGH